MVHRLRRSRCRSPHCHFEAIFIAGSGSVIRGMQRRQGFIVQSRGHPLFPTVVTGPAINNQRDGMHLLLCLSLSFACYLIRSPCPVLLRPYSSSFSTNPWLILAASCSDPASSTLVARRSTYA